MVTSVSVQFTFAFTTGGCKGSPARPPLIGGACACRCCSALRRTVHSHADCALAHGGARNRSAINRLQTANLPRTASIQNVCRLQALIEPQRSEGRDNKGANRHRGGSGGNFPRMRQPWRNTSASFAIKGGRGRRIAPLESTEAHAIKRAHTKSKIPLWRAPGRGGGVSPCKKKRNHAKYQKKPSADCTPEPQLSRRYLLSRASL